MNLLRINKSIILILVSAPMLMGCSESISEGAYIPSLSKQYFSVTPRNFEFSNNEETKNGTIKSENGWSFSETPSWLIVSPTSGNSDSEFSLTSQENGSSINREAIFYVTSNVASSKIQRVITASQNGANPYISLPEYDTSTVAVDGKGENLNIAVESNIQDLTASFSQPWGTASYNPEAKKVSLVIQGNETNVSREGILIVSSQQLNKTAKLTISQLASGVSILGGMSLEYEANGGTQKRTISSDLPWTAQTSSSWIEFSPASGDAGETAMNITALPSYDSDNRIGQIYFYFGDVEKKYIDVSQSGRFITPNVSTCNLPGEEGSTTEVIVDANIDWAVSSHPDWLEISPSSGNVGSTTIMMTASENKSLNARNSSVVLQDSNSGNIQSIINVTQEGIEHVNGNSLELNWKSAIVPLSIPFSSQWEATVSKDWISLSKYSGNGEETIEVSVAKNETEELREGRIVVASEGKSFEVPITQQGQYLTLGSTVGEFDWNGGESELFVSTSINTEYIIEYETEGKDWVNITAKDSEYIISVLSNNSINSRKAIMYILPLDEEVNENLSQGIKFNIIQTGRTLNVNTSEIYMTSSGGTSSEYLIEADGNYKITRPDNQYWFSINHNSSTNTFSVTTTQNTNAEARQGMITISLEDLPTDEKLEKNISIIQDNYISIETVSEIRMPSEGGRSAVYRLEPNGSYQVSRPSSDYWFSISYNNTNNTFYITCTENKNENNRRSTISIIRLDLESGEKLEKEIRVIQYGTTP